MHTRASRPFNQLAMKVCVRRGDCILVALRDAWARSGPPPTSLAITHLIVRGRSVHVAWWRLNELVRDP
eukprot:COSAG02_NODE_5847_length_3991_cov_2.061665_4_plen_69_part_00